MTCCACMDCWADEGHQIWITRGLVQGLTEGGGGDWIESHQVIVLPMIMMMVGNVIKCQFTLPVDARISRILVNRTGIELGTVDFSMVWYGTCIIFSNLTKYLRVVVWKVTQLDLTIYRSPYYVHCQKKLLYNMDQISATRFPCTL